MKVLDWRERKDLNWEKGKILTYCLCGYINIKKVENFVFNLIEITIEKCILAWFDLLS